MARGVLSGIPLAGGLASEIFNLVIAPPLTKRRDEWMESIARGLKELEENIGGFKIKELSKNESFLTTLMHSTHLALRNHQKEKLEALRNAVLNSALPNATEEDMQILFINFIDELTLWHLRVLWAYNDIKNWVAKRNIKLPSLSDDVILVERDIIENIFPALNRDFYMLIYNDLTNKALISGNSTFTVNLGIRVACPTTTELGKRFLEFIASPSETI